MGWSSGMVEVGVGHPSGAGPAAVAARMLRIFLLEGRLILESMERLPLVMRLDQARRPGALAGADWAQGLIGWSLLLYSTWRVVDAGVLAEDGAGLLTAAWARAGRDPLGLAELSVKMGEDPKWRGLQLGIWRDDVVHRSASVPFGNPRLTPLEAIRRVGTSRIGRTALAQAAVLADEPQVEVKAVYRALRHLALALAEGGRQLPPLGAAVVPVLERLVFSAPSALQAPLERSISTDGR